MHCPSQHCIGRGTKPWIPGFQKYVVFVAVWKCQGNCKPGDPCQKARVTGNRRQTWSYFIAILWNSLPWTCDGPASEVNDQLKKVIWTWWTELPIVRLDVGPSVEQSNVFGGGISLREWRFERSSLTVSLPWRRLCVHVRSKVVIGAHVISAEQFFSFVFRRFTRRPERLKNEQIYNVSKCTAFGNYVGALPFCGTCCTKNDLIVKSWMKWRWLRPHPKWIYSTSRKQAMLI